MQKGAALLEGNTTGVPATSCGSSEQDPATFGDHKVNPRYFSAVPGGDVCISQQVPASSSGL